jgi:hypothetical protein
MLPAGALAAAIANDLPRLRRMVELARQMPVNGRLGAMERSAAEDLLLIAEGRVSEAMPGLREALRLADEMSAQLIYGFVALALLRFIGPQSPEARAAGEQALANFERNKNRAMAGHIRAALAAVGPAEQTVGAEAVRVGV